MRATGLVDEVTQWFDREARDLPWRRAGTAPWAVLVSEVMLQQTPVARVLPAYEAWLARWPTPASLADEAPGEAVRMWGRLGYPRRALRLHAAAVAMVERYDGEVPRSVSELLSLPGVGDYTARAVASFAYRQRQAVVDTNVRRVVARVVEGVADAVVTRADFVSIALLLPAEDEQAAVASAALMELGALICTARAPRCPSCPVADRCAWLAAGQPALATPLKRPQGYTGTDRQVRGRLLAVLRDAEGPVAHDLLTQVWAEPVQRERALASLVTDGLAIALPEQHFALP